MDDITETVCRILDQDIHLQEGIARGILNQRATARWIKKTYDLGGSIETVYKAVKEYKPPGPRGDRNNPWDALNEVRISRTKPVASLNVERGPQVQDRIGEVLMEVINVIEDSVALSGFNGHLSLTIENQYLETTAETLGYDQLRGPPQDLFLIALRSKHGDILDSGPVAHLALALLHRGIPVPFIGNSGDEMFLGVPIEHQPAAYDLVLQLVAED